MNGGGSEGRTRIATGLGIAVAVGVLLVLVLMPAASSALRPELQGVVAASNTSCHVGGDPQFPGYDPVNQEVYVPNFTTGNISVLKGTCTLAGTIKLPKNAEPYQALFDPANNYMFVTDYNLNQIYEISGMKIVDTYTNSSLGGDLWGPTAMTYDTASIDAYNAGALVITNYNGNFITYLQVFQGYQFGTIPVGQSPDAIAFNPTDNAVWVANEDSDNITVVNIDWYIFYQGIPSEVVKVEASLPVGSGLDAVAVDMANGFVYVANFGSNNVTVWNGGSTVEGYSIYLGTLTYESVISGLDGPSGATWDQSTLQVDITSINNQKVYAVGGGNVGNEISKKYSMPSDSFPTGAAYDAANGDMYVTCVGTNSVYVIA